MGWARRHRWAIGGVTAAVLISVTWWLLAQGTRGAEIANVLALPLAVIATAVGIWALSAQFRDPRVRLEDSRGRGLVRVRARQIADQLGVRVKAKSRRNDLELGPVVVEYWAAGLTWGYGADMISIHVCRAALPAGPHRPRTWRYSRCGTRWRCCAGRTPDRGCRGPTGPCSLRWPGSCPRGCGPGGS